ncbi:unnamed protein product, partial [Brachionus calyciflorus]
MSKLSFRSRQVDYTKPLPIYLNNDIPDLQDFAAINRSVPQMPTGMEKDEEAEHHLQRALSALQVYGTTTSNEYAIPTPNVEVDIQMCERIYNVECPKQKQYIRIQPFSNDFDYPDYDADIEDEEWLNEYKKKLPDDFTDDFFLFFEKIMDRLEKAVGFSTNLISRDEAKLILLEKDEQIEENLNEHPLDKTNKYKSEKDEFILCIYDYWKSKRLKCNHPLTPTVMTDRCGVVTQPNNPYLVFRRRTEKMQTRKNRKTEEQSYEKMLILKRDLIRAQQILKLIKQRENLKKEFLKLTLETFEKRLKLNDQDGTIIDSIKTSLLKTKCPSMGTQPVLVQTKNNPTIDKKISSLIQNKSPCLKRELTDTNKHNIPQINPKKFKKDKKLSPLNVNIQQPTSIVNNNSNNINKSNNLATPTSHKTLSISNNLLNKTDKNRRLIRRPLPGAMLTPTKIEQNDYGDLANTNLTKTPSPRIEPVIISNEDNEYNEELKQNNIENIESSVSEAKNKFCTSVEKDGYWSFKRKEGCKYLAQNGSIFKNDAFDYLDSHESETVANTQQHQPIENPFQISNTKSKQARLRQIQHKVYGYLVSRNRHLGLVRRRVGRGGRILLDKLNQKSIDMLKQEPNPNSTNFLSESNQFYSFENFSKFKTFHPVDNKNNFREETVAVVPENNSETDDDELDRIYYDHKMFTKLNPDIPFTAHVITSEPSSQNTTIDDNEDKMETDYEILKTNLNFYDMEPSYAIENFNMDELFDTDLETNKYESTNNYVKIDFRPILNDENCVQIEEDFLKKINLKKNLKNFIPLKKESVKKKEEILNDIKSSEPPSRINEDNINNKQIKIEPKLLNALANSQNSTISNYINKLDPVYLTLPIMNGNKYTSTSTSSLPSSSASSSSSSSSSPLSNTTTTKPNPNQQNGNTNGTYLYTSNQSAGLALNGIASKSN